jgi:chromosome segregation ATPase
MTGNEGRLCMSEEMGIVDGMIGQKLPRDMEMIMTAFLPNLKHLESRFDRIDLNIKELSIGVKDTNNRLTALEKRMDYFEVQVDKRFDLIIGDMKEFKTDVNRRFEQMDRRFDLITGDMKEFKADVNRRFEQVDKRFENVDRRLDQIATSIERLGDKLDARDARQRSFTMRMFGIAISVSFLGVLGVMARSFGLI